MKKTLKLKSKFLDLSFLFLTIVSLSFAGHSQTHSNDTSTVALDESKPAMTAEYALSKLVKAMEQTNYDMSLIVYRPGSEPIPYVWRRGTLDGERVELLNELNGPGAQIIRFGKQVSYFEADKPAYTLSQEYVKGLLPHNLLHAPEAFSQAYDVIYVGRARVAGLSTHQLRIVSKDKSRYSYALWLDEASFLPLKFSTFTLEGELLELVQVTHLNVTDIAHPDFAQVDRGTLPPVQHLNPSKNFTLQWTISKLPVGMQEVKKRVTRLGITGELVEHLLLSDGLVDVSVYLQPSGEVAQEDVLLRNQSDTFLARVKDNVQVTVIGKIPAQTANTIMQYIRTKP